MFTKTLQQKRQFRQEVLKQIMEKNFVIAGFGGQGVLLAGEVLANAFMLDNKKELIFVNSFLSILLYFLL